MNKSIFTLAMVAAALCVGGAETLSLSFNEAQKVAVNNREYAIEGNFKDGCLAVGRKGVYVPGATLVGNNQGTLVLTFKTQKESAENVQRSLMHLRTGSRLSIGFNYYRGGEFQFFFSDNTKARLYHNLKKVLAPGAEHTAIISWDGKLVKCYFDGKLVAEKVQPCAITAQVRNLNFGPYKDGWMAPKFWTDEALLKSAKVFNTAITSDEAAALSK